MRWKNTSDLALLRYTINARTLLGYAKGTGIEVICSCMNIESSQLAITSILCLKTITTACEFFSFMEKVPLCSLSNCLENAWEYLSVPRKNYNVDVIVLHTYCPEEISSLLPTSTSVVLNSRRSRVRKRIAERLSCLLC